jgi:hypothetical protein
MRVLIDAVPITGASTAIVTEHLLNAWADLDTDDEIHVVIGPAAEFDISPKLHVHRVPRPRPALPSPVGAVGHHPEAVPEARHRHRAGPYRVDHHHTPPVPP